MTSAPARPVVGMIGAGGIANGHLSAWLSLGHPVVVHSLEGAADLVARHGGGRVVDSLEELLAAADVIDVCTPTPTHRALVEQVADAAAANGIAGIICEKPLGRTVADATAMVEACEAAGVPLLPGHIVRFFPEYAPMHAQVTDGVVGRIAVQRFTRIGSRPLKDWYHDFEQSGGIILDQMIHDLDFARWNAGEVVEVFARTHDPDPGRDVTSSQVVLTHADGAITTCFSGWAPVGATFRTVYSVSGDSGYLRHDSAERSPLQLDLPGAVAEQGGLLPSMAWNESPFVTELRELMAAIETGVEPRVSARDGLAAVAIAEAANESLRTGRAVRLESPINTTNDDTTNDDSTEVGA